MHGFADAHGVADQFPRLCLRSSVARHRCGPTVELLLDRLSLEMNMHSPLAEVAICMSIYAMIPLAVENIPPVLERLWYFDSRLRPGVESIEKRLHAFFPIIIAAAYLLPG